MPASAPAADTSRRGLDDYTVRTWNESDGLAGGRITAIAQDRDGYLWIGTDGGLVRFDGVRFQPITGLGDTSLPFGAVTTLLTARDQSLWIGVGRIGVTRMRGHSFTSYGERDGFEGVANSLLEQRDGTIWAGSSRGLFRFDGQRWFKTPQDSGLDGEAVLAMHEDRAGRFWIATRQAVFRSARAGARFERVDVIQLSSNIWQAFSEDASGVVWISDFRDGFRRADENSATPPRRVRGWGVKLLHDRQGNLWLATRGQGLWRMRATHAADQTPDVITVKEGLANDAVQCVFEDREGNIWVGTHAGLQRLTPRKVTPLIDLPSARATALTPDGRVWVGTTAGLFAFSSDGRRQYREAEGLPGIVVLALFADSHGTLWVATERALARFDGERFTSVLTLRGLQRVFGMAESDGALWLRDVNLHVLRLDRAESTSEAADLPEAVRTTATTISGDRAGRLWIGTIGGTVGVRHPGGRFESFAAGIGAITAIFEDDSGVIWFGGERGLSRRLTDGRFETLTRGNALPSGVNSIVEDERGVLWLGMRSGIGRFEKDEIGRALAAPDHQPQYRLFNSADGAAGIPVTGGSRGAVRGNDGRLWFATSGGITIVNPADIGKPRPPVPVRIEAVVADTKPFDAESDLRLPPRTSHVQFSFTALTMTDPMRVQFRYRLEGQDQGWVDAGTSRQRSYTNLRPGSYRFLVSASNGEGLWSEPGAVLSFSIPPMFYQTGWFFALCILAAISAVYGAWKLNAHRVRGQFALVIAERIRMSRAIHDTLLQSLAGLALQLDDLSHGADAPASLKARVLTIRRRVEDSIREARQSIWALRSPALDSKPFPDALRDAGLRAIDGRPVAFDFRTAGTPRPCSPAVEEQLLRICQEAVTNAVQHGQPTHVGVELEYESDAVRVRVRDDGCGFDPADEHSVEGHYGVLSMRERAAQVRGRLTIASAPGEGTRVETVVPPM
jgi:ligand-binding sensor domain-containing protein/signal transduction histidine kinase